MTLTLDDIQAAAKRIADSVVRTPLALSRTLSDIAGCELYLKFENHQFTASFKERGALNCLLSLNQKERAAGVIAMSAGNHAQAVAYHARRLGLRAVIVMPKNTPNVKVQNTRKLGAEVHLQGTDVAEAGAYARRLAADHGLTFIHPYDDERVMAGQGTMALEMLADCPQLDALVVPVGGGGLIAGNAIAARALRPAMEIIGVQAARFPAMCQALAGQPIQNHMTTIAEGIAVKEPGQRTLPLIREHVTELMQVAEHGIERAILMLLEIEKTVTEGAGAVGLAAILAEPERFRGRRVGVVLSGGNIDLLRLSAAIERGMVRTDRIVRVRVGVPDHPGALADLTRRLADQHANVIEIAHQRAFTDLSLRSAEVEIVYETLGGDHNQRIIQALRDAGYDTLLAATEPHPSERKI
ncbi:MAG TPA: threonine ammonia-lyase [Salinisphaeraceae bacterium]|nr:threonine ammonia-lyase [Salinisphaeraceae bacterium]